MAASRGALIWGLVAEQAVGRGGQVTAVDVCAAAVEVLPVSGAWVTARSAGGVSHVMGVTDEIGEQQDAFASGSPVLISDLDDGDAARDWPGFTPQARQVKAAAIFALPLRIGAIRVGSLGLYRDTPGPLSTLEFGDALILAETATVVLLDSQHPDGQAPAAGTGPAGQPPDLARHRAEIDQATGMVSEQLGVALAEAFVRLRAYAYAQDRRLGEVARDIVARRLRLSPDPHQGS
jgi:hypothetical protein